MDIIIERASEQRREAYMFGVDCGGKKVGERRSREAYGLRMVWEIRKGERRSRKAYELKMV